jgi:hypothetical protein
VARSSLATVGARQSQYLCLSHPHPDATSIALLGGVVAVSQPSWQGPTGRDCTAVGQLHPGQQFAAATHEKRPAPDEVASGPHLLRVDIAQRNVPPRISRVNFSLSDFVLAVTFVSQIVATMISIVTNRFLTRIWSARTASGRLTRYCSPSRLG